MSGTQLNTLVSASNYIVIMKLLNLILSTILMTLSTSAMAQSVVKGYVLEYNGTESKTPLSNVEIVVSNAGSTVSDENGAFTIHFRQLKPGDPVSVRRITKVGYEIFNTDVVDHWYIAKDSVPFIIVMCKSDKLHETQRQMIDVANRKATFQFEQDQRRLHVDKVNKQFSEEDYQRQLNQLKRDYEAKLENIDNYIDRFVRIDLSSLSNDEKKIVKYVQTGEFEKAIQLYEQQNLSTKLLEQGKTLEKLDAASAEFNKAEQNLRRQLKSVRQSILRQTDLLRMQGGEDAHNKILSILHDFAMVDTTNAENMRLYAQELHSRSDYQGAYNVYVQMAKSALQQNDSITLLLARSFQSKMLLLMGRYTEGLQMSKENLPQLDSLRRMQSDTLSLLSDVADICQAVAVRLAVLNRYDEAYGLFTKGLNSLRSLRLEAKSKDVDSQYALFLVQYGSAMRNSKWGYKSEHLVREGVSLFESLYNEKPYFYEARLAFAYSNLGLVYVSQGAEYEENAEAAFLESDRHYIKSVERNPVSYSRFRSNNLINLGELYLSQERYVYAIEVLKEADRIMRSQPLGTLKFQRQLSDVNSNLGRCYYLSKDYDNALRCDLNSLDEIEPLYAKDPEAFRSRMGTCLVYLCNVYLALDDQSKAYEFAKRAYSIDPSNEEVIKRWNELNK